MEGIKLTIDNVSVDFSNMDKILTLLLQSSNKELKISGDSCLTPEKVVTANSKKEKSPKRTEKSVVIKDWLLVLLTDYHLKRLELVRNCFLVTQ